MFMVCCRPLVDAAPLGRCASPPTSRMRAWVIGKEVRTEWQERRTGQPFRIVSCSMVNWLFEFQTATESQPSQPAAGLTPPPPGSSQERLPAPHLFNPLGGSKIKENPMGDAWLRHRGTAMAPSLSLPPPPPGGCLRPLPRPAAAEPGPPSGPARPPWPCPPVAKAQPAAFLWVPLPPPPRPSWLALGTGRTSGCTHRQVAR